MATLQSQNSNAAFLEKEMQWLGEIVNTRGSISLAKENSKASITEIPPPDVSRDTSYYAAMIKQCSMTFEERIVLVLALAPYVKPELLDVFFSKNETYDKNYTEFGGVKGIHHSGFIPTIQTAIFIVAGYNLDKRIALLHVFDQAHFFAKKNILEYKPSKHKEPFSSNILTVSDEYLVRLTTGQVYRPTFGAQFPAAQLTTPLGWQDLVLPQETLDAVGEIKTWIKHGNTLLYDLGFEKKFKKGYRALFSGPSGTGKTLTAALLGKETQVDLYKIDLAMVVSKYIGETEKNLSRVFDQAENKNWILFFDEADALFGQRTMTKDAHDRHANQEVSYLLQKIEDFPGVVILATNFKNNIDSAFLRRFQSIIEFCNPDEEQRLQLWNNAFEGPYTLDKRIDLEKIAEAYEISGGLISNVLRYCTLQALSKNKKTIDYDDLIIGIKRELQKEGKTAF